MNTKITGPKFTTVQLVAFAAISSAATGCTGPYLQQVTVASSPASARLDLDCYDNDCGSKGAGLTPAQLELDRTRDHVVTVRRAGYEDQHIVLKSKFNPVSVVANFLGGFGFGFGFVMGYSVANPDTVNWNGKKGLGPTLEVGLLFGAVLGGVNVLANGIYGAATRRDFALYPGKLTIKLERPRVVVPTASVERRNLKNEVALRKMSEARELNLQGNHERAEALLLGIYQACGDDCEKKTSAQLSLLMGAVHLCRGAAKDESINAFARALELDPNVAWDDEVSCDEARSTFDALKKPSNRSVQPVASSEKSPVDEARELIRDHKVDTAESLIVAALEDTEHPSSATTRAALWVLRGIISSDSRNKPLLAREAFEKALKLDPNVKIDETLAKPQAVDIFNAVRDEH